MKNKFSAQELQAKEWIKKAEEDRLFAESILRHKDAPPSGVCFHSHQAAEKLFKAFLVFHKKRFPKIHETDALWELCREIDESFDDIKESAIFLTEFYVETRYPGDYPDFFWEDAEKAYAAAVRIKEFVLDKIDKI